MNSEKRDQLLAIVQQANFALTNLRKLPRGATDKKVHQALLNVEAAKEELVGALNTASLSLAELLLDAHTERTVLRIGAHTILYGVEVSDAVLLSAHIVGLDEQTSPSHSIEMLLDMVWHAPGSPGHGRHFTTRYVEGKTVFDKVGRVDTLL